MSKVILDMSLSLDGFISPVDETDGRLHDWYFSPSADNQKIIADLIKSTGAIVMGKRSYDLGNQFDGYADNPYQVPHIIITHHVPEKLPKGETEFIFITDGVEKAIQAAQSAAGERNVIIGGGANIVQQLLNAKLIDEIHLHLVPVLLGDGVRLFANLNAAATELKIIDMQKTELVTHIQYRVVK